MMHLLETISTISLFIVTFGLFAIIALSAANLTASVTSDALACSDRLRKNHFAIETASVDRGESIRPVGMPVKGHHKPCAEVCKVMTAIRSMDAGMRKESAAKAHGYGSVALLDKAIRSNGQAARRLMRAEA